MYQIKLRKCAYIFDNSASRFKYGTKQAEEDAAKQNILKDFYNNADKRAEWIPANKKTVTFWDGSTVEQVQINLNGYIFNLNALQIAETNDPAEIYNHKKIISFDGFKSVNFHTFTKNSIYSNNFKSFEFEEFSGVEDLGYFRVHFKNNCYKFIIDDTNNLYTAEGVEHKPITRGNILERLEITSAKASKEFAEVMDYLQNRSNQAGEV